MTIDSLNYRNESEHFSNTYKSHYKRLCAYAYQFVSDHYTAEDIVQNSFLKLWERNQKIDFSYGLTSLLYTVVRRTSIDYLNKKKDEPQAREALEMLSKENTINEMIYSETLVEIYRISKYLPEKYGSIFRRLFIEGKKHSEVASELNITEGNLRMQKSRALSFIRNHFLKIPALFLIFPLAYQNETFFNIPVANPWDDRVNLMLPFHIHPTVYESRRIPGSKNNGTVNYWLFE